MNNNWNENVRFIEKILESWKHKNLAIYAKIIVINVKAHSSVTILKTNSVIT